MISIEPYTGGLYSKIPIICGPTASGKSSLAMNLCLVTGGELCSMDSMQVYRHMDIGTAKPTKEEQQTVPHHLIDLIEPTDNFNVSMYKTAAITCIGECLNRGHIPVFCGGTGQYASALSQGISYIPIDVDPLIHETLLKEADTKGYGALYDQLTVIDPAGAEKIHPNNQKRVIRALEIYRMTGKTMTYFNEQSKKDGPQYPFVLFAIDWDRDVLYERMDLRVDQMLKNGLLDEVMKLQAMGLTPQHTAMQAIGYKELFAFLEGYDSYDDAVAKIKQKTRNYGKRQLTWFRNMGGVTWIRPDDVSAVLEMIRDQVYITDHS